VNSIGHISTDGQGRVIDNIFIERLWRMVKYEEVYLKDYVDVVEALSNLKTSTSSFGLSNAGDRPRGTMKFSAGFTKKEKRSKKRKKAAEGEACRNRYHRGNRQRKPSATSS
jgi:putative transposase